MCEQIEKKILFQQGKYETSNSNYQTSEMEYNIHNSTGRHALEMGNGNAVYVELRRMEYDTILECVVLVDGREEIISKTVMSNGAYDFENIRHAIARFDELVANHPMSARVKA